MANTRSRRVCDACMHDGADHGTAAAAARARPEGGGLGVSLVDRHVVHVDAQVLGHQLRRRRLETLSVGSRSQVHVDVPVGGDAHVGRLVGIGSHTGLRLDVERQPNAEQAAVRLRLALGGPEGVVTDGRRRRSRHSSGVTFSTTIPMALV